MTYTTTSYITYHAYYITQAIPLYTMQQVSHVTYHISCTMHHICYATLLHYRTYITHRTTQSCIMFHISHIVHHMPFIMYNTSYHITYNITPYHIMPCPSTYHYAMLCHAVPRYSLLVHSTIGFASATSLV